MNLPCSEPGHLRGMVSAEAAVFFSWIPQRTKADNSRDTCSVTASSSGRLMSRVAALPQNAPITQPPGMLFS